MPARPAARRNRHCTGFTASERRVHRAEQHAAMRRILGCIGDAEPLAHRIVDLRRVEPHMRVGERQPVRHQPCPRDAKRLTRIVIGRRGERLLRTAAAAAAARSARRRAAPPAPARRRRPAAVRARPGRDRAARRPHPAPRRCARPAASVAGSAATCACSRASCRRFISSRSRSVSHQPMSVRPSVS